MTGWLLSLLSWLPWLPFGQGPDAETAYRDGRFAEALALYRAELATAPDRAGPLLHNMGNCAFQLGLFAEASLHYRRALLRMPGSHDARHNLQLCERHLGVSPPPQSAWSWFDESPHAVWRLGLVLQAAGVAGVVLLRRRGRRIAAAAVIVAGIALLLRVDHVQDRPPEPFAVVLESQTPARAAPNIASIGGFELLAGELVRVGEVRDGWLHVRGERGDGWVQTGAVGMVD